MNSAPVKRLRSCDRWHPGEPSELGERQTGRRDCLLCGRRRQANYMARRARGERSTNTCYRLHPDTPPRLSEQSAGLNADGSVRTKTACLECMKVREQRYRRELRLPSSMPRLNWTPPERLL